MCSELSPCNVPVLIIAPLSCSPPIYKDLLGSPLHLKFSFISTGVTADSWSSFPPAAGKCGWDSLLHPHPWNFRGTVVWTGWSSVGTLEDVMGVSALQPSWWPCGILVGRVILGRGMLPAFGAAMQELQGNFVMGEPRALSSCFLPPWPE